MIAAVRGKLEGKSLDSAFVTVGGVTLRVYAPLNTLANLNAGEEVHLWTYLLVREDVLALYGFATETDRETFETLLSVGGVGPRIAVSLISSMPGGALQEAVMSEDLQRLTLTPGVGRKLAGRLVLELKPKFEKQGQTMPASQAGVSGGNRAAVAEALTNLGYPPNVSSAAARSLPDGATGSIEDLIMQALRSLAKE
jgi:holliday junction DNA helicase RuvA